MANKFKSQLPIIMVLLFSCFLNSWELWNETVNSYYSAAVFSMGENLHAFFYNSYDSIGFITVDKPPLGLWIQVLFTKAFGFNGFILLLPQAICGVLSVYFIYKIISTRISKKAGIISALVFSLTPIFVAISRNNTIDGVLILMLVLASEQAIIAAEKTSIKNLIFAGIFISLGFNVKMLQAFMIVPAVYLTYLVFSKGKITRRIVSCFISIIIMLVISFSWIIAVDLTPVENRPYIGSSGTNSAFDLAVGYNGITRVFGGPQPPNTPDKRPSPPNKNNITSKVGLELGNPSISRFFNSSISGQISWFLIPALFSSLFCLYLIFKRKLKENQKNITLFFFTMCFFPMIIYFSFSNGLAHRYYLSMLSFVIAPLVGFAFSILKEKNLLTRSVLPIAYFITALAQLYIQSLYKNWLTGLLPVFAFVLTATTVITFLFRNKITINKLIAPLMISLFLLPALWSFTPIIYKDNANIPIAGPELINKSDALKEKLDLTDLVLFLKENQDDANFLAAVPSALELGNELILQSHEPVMALGGFNGSDIPLTEEEFKEYIKFGKVKYAVFPINREEKPMDRNSKDKISNWIINNCEKSNRQFKGVILYKLSIES